MFRIALTLLTATLFSLSANAEKISLDIGLIRAGGQNYFVDLLDQSLKAQGHEVTIKIIGKLPQKRMLYMLQNNQLSLTWLVQSQQRDDTMPSVKVGLTNGLIGHRILLIPEGSQPIYDSVNTLEDFRNLKLTGVFGKGWFDVAVWRQNKLNLIEQDGGWQTKVYRQISSKSRGVDYFSRGFFEILDEAREHPFLDVEQRLMFVYNRDFRFYLSESGSQYSAIIEKSLKAAKASGLMDKLVQKHWSEAFTVLNPGKRIKIPLQSPNSKLIK